MLKLFYAQNIISLNKFNNYHSFITVFKNQQPNTTKFYVYNINNISIISIDEKNDKRFTFQFSFYAFNKKQNKTKKINFQVKNNPLTTKLTNIYPKNNFVNLLSFYYLNDLYYDDRITIKKNNNYLNSFVKTSIIMAYYKRSEQLKFTIKTFLKSKNKNFELIICNDGSDDDINIDYPFPVLLININKKYKDDKQYKNPCIPYNMCIEYIRGENVIIQNPECCHIGDVLSYVNSNLNKNNYLVFSCLSLNSDNTNFMKNNFDENISNKLIEISKTKQKLYGNYNHLTWYIHPTLRPKFYHFTSSIHISNLRKIKGFSELFAFGVSYDDDELVSRIINLKLQMNIIDPKLLFVVHQYHEKTLFKYSNLTELENINKQLFFELQSSLNLLN